MKRRGAAGRAFEGTEELTGANDGFLKDIGEAAGDEAAGLLAVGAAGAEHDEGGGAQMLVFEDDIGQLFAVHFG